jgi:hypothetical protein
VRARRWPLRLARGATVGSVVLVVLFAGLFVAEVMS